FTPMITPTLVLPESMEGTGFLGEHADEVYHLDKDDDLYLVGTSEVALAGYHKDEIIDLEGGPLRYAGWSACYRREAGSYGKDTRGIIRVHQFHKVEMFSYCRIEDSYEEHERLLDWEREMMARIDVPYRIIDTAAGDLGTSAARKNDCEAWMPSQDTYRELTSTSNTTQFQARRLNIRERTEDGMRPVATLNGTLGTTRFIAATLENHQQPAPLPPRRLLWVLVPGRSTGSSGAYGTLEDLTSTATTDREAPRTRLEEHLSGLAGQRLLIGLDVDGTLVDHDGAMTPAMHRTLQRAADEHVVVIATGRSLGATLPIVEAAGITRGYAVRSEERRL